MKLFSEVSFSFSCFAFFLCSIPTDRFAYRQVSCRFLSNCDDSNHAVPGQRGRYELAAFCGGSSGSMLFCSRPILLTCVRVPKMREIYLCVAEKLTFFLKTAGMSAARLAVLVLRVMIEEDTVDNGLSNPQAVINSNNA